MAPTEDVKTELEWNPRAIGWAAGLTLALLLTLALPLWAPAFRLRASDGGFGLEAPLLLLVLLPLEWILVATALAGSTLSGLRISVAPATRVSLRAYRRSQWTIGLENSSSSLPGFFLRVRFDMTYEGEELRSVSKWIGFLPPRGRADIAWDLVFRRRGVAAISRLVAETTVPGSLFRRRKVFGVAQTFDVLPLLYELAPGASELLSGRRYSATSRVHLVPAGSEEFVGVRAYRPGDNPRYINYALSLRMPDFPNDLVVREFEDPGEENVCVILDSVVPRVGSDSTEFLYRFEKAVAFVASLARRFAEKKHRVRVLSVGGRNAKMDVTVGARRDDVHALDLELARLNPTEDLEEYYRVVRQALAVLRAPAIFISLRDNVAIAPSGRAAVVLGPQAMGKLIERTAADDR